MKLSGPFHELGWQISNWSVAWDEGEFSYRTDKLSAMHMVGIQWNLFL